MKSLIAVSMHKAGSTIADRIILEFCKAKGYETQRISAGVSKSPLAEEDYFISYQEKMHTEGVYYGMARGTYVKEMNVISDLRAIVQVRDPRDCITSAYFSYRESHKPPKDPAKLQRFQARRQNLQQMEIDEFASRAAYQYRERMEVLDKLIAEHPDYLLVTYEDMVERTGDWLQTISNFLEQPLTAELRELIDTKMNFEVAQESPSSHKRQVIPGDHKRKLKPETIAAMNEELAPMLDRFGYERR